MGTTTLVPLAEYLKTVYEPDCDYVDGEVQERNLGEQDHSDLQTRLIKLLLAGDNERHIRANAEIRVQVKTTRFRVPDVCVRLRSAPSEQILRTPPLVCLEVLSPEDTMSRTRVRVRDYIEMGVSEVWIFDPELRVVYVCRGATMVEQRDGTLTVPGTPVTLALADVFSALDTY